MSKTRKWYTKGLYLVFALALLVGLSVAPAAALSQPVVTVTDPTISVETDYSIVFTLGKQVPDDAKIVVEFPTGTDLTNVVNGDIGIKATLGIDSSAITAGTFTIVKSPSTTKGPKLTATLTGLTGDTKIDVGAVVQLTVSTHVGNPATVGSYTLDVSTLTSANVTIEAAVTSGSYSIKAPTIAGTVYVYNNADPPVLMETFAGDTALNSGNAGKYYDKVNYTIEVGPGTYKPSSIITISGKGLTFKSTDGADTTIINADTSSLSPAIRITGDDVIVDGFTIKPGGVFVISILDAAGVTVQNNIVTSTTFVVGIESAGGLTDNATISDNTLENADIYLTAGGNTVSGNAISGSKITEGGITLQAASTGNIISENTVSGVTAGVGIQLGHTTLPGTIDDNLIQGNTLSGNGKGIWLVSGMTLTNLIITGNDITDNTGVGIQIDEWEATNDVIKFNNITGNDTTNGYGLQNESGGDVDATHNWWGSAVASEVAAMINDVGASDDTDYTPFLTDTVDTVFSATAVDTAKLSLDAETEVGVEVLVSAGAGDVKVISAAKYIANPGAPLDNALAFYDVYVTGTLTADTDTVTLKFYAGDADALLYAWSSVSESWVAVSPAAAFSEFGGFLYVTLNTTAATTPSTPTIGDLTELPFAVCAGVPVKVLESISALPSSVSLDVGDTQAITVTATYDDASTADVTATSTYVSDAEAVATVSAAGVITAVAEGSAIITVSYTEGGVTKTDTVAVTVGWNALDAYDENGDGVISKAEAVNAVQDYFNGLITKVQAIEVVTLYFA